MLEISGLQKHFGALRVIDGVDLTVPAGMIAGQPYLRIAEPRNPDKAGELMADDVRMVRWSAPGSGGRLYDTVRFETATRAHLVSD